MFRVGSAMSHSSLFTFPSSLMSRLPQVLKNQLHLPSGQSARGTLVAHTLQLREQTVGRGDVLVQQAQGRGARGTGKVELGELALGEGLNTLFHIFFFIVYRTRISRKTRSFHASHDFNFTQITQISRNGCIARNARSCRLRRVLASRRHTRVKRCVLREIAFPLRPANTFREICVRQKISSCDMLYMI